MTKRGQNEVKASNKWEMMQKGGQANGTGSDKWEMMQRGGKIKGKDNDEEIVANGGGQNKGKASNKWEMMKGGSQNKGKASDKGEIQSKGKASKKEEMKKRGQIDGQSGDIENSPMDIRTILKDIELLGHANMTWKERKELENKKVVALGGKPQKKQRLPLSVAKVPMKKQKERERKMLLENQLFGKFEGIAKLKKKKDKRQEPESKGMKPTEGYFRNGVLEVKHLLKSGGPSSDRMPRRFDINIGGEGRDGGKNKGGGGKKKSKGGKKKGKGGKRR